MFDKITEKLDAIEASHIAKLTEATDSVRNELTEKITALEAKIAEVQAPAIIRAPAKSIRQDVDRKVRGELAEFAKMNNRVQKEIKLFDDESQYAAYLSEAAGLAAGGAGIGGRTAYDPVFTAFRLMNPMRGLSRSNATDGATYQWRAKVGNAGATWGYAIQNNGSATTEATNIWQLTLADVNCQFPIRTAALDDIDGLESNIVADMLAEFSQVEAQSMILNSDQTDSPNTYGGTSGLRGLNQYAGSNASYTGGTISAAAFGTSGTGSTSGLHSLATYDQLTSNVNTVGANAIVYKDVINFIYSLPQQYWTASAKFMINPILLQGIRGLVDGQQRPIYVDGLARDDGIVGTLLGFDVVVNKYLNNPSQATTGTAGTTSQFPMYFGDWQRGHGIVDRLNMVLRRYDQTQPGFITFFGEKRLATSVIDPNAIIRYRSTGTAT